MRFFSSFSYEQFETIIDMFLNLYSFPVKCETHTSTQDGKEAANVSIPTTTSQLIFFNIIIKIYFKAYWRSIKPDDFKIKVIEYKLRNIYIYLPLDLPIRENDIKDFYDNSILKPLTNINQIFNSNAVVRR